MSTMNQPDREATKRVHVTFATKTYELLQRIAARKGEKGNVSAALRQSIILTDYLESAQEDGGRILIDRNGQVSELVLR